MDKINPGDQAQSKGKTTIAPEVLLNIARLTALEVQGVSRMSNVPGGVNRLFKRGAGEGVRIEIREDTVYADLYVVLAEDVNIRDVSRQVQRSVARAITEMVGMNVGRVNVHIEDIDYPATETKDNLT
ncbi:MAG: Asp23/Gls24 family envelope stress response protein [Anaerolineales bacterium]|nr:Asp23/Gls24 family envelope stress response protein [Anaerolineales bacterium]